MQRIVECRIGISHESDGSIPIVGAHKQSSQITLTRTYHSSAFVRSVSFRFFISFGRCHYGCLQQIRCIKEKESLRGKVYVLIEQPCFQVNMLCTVNRIARIQCHTHILMCRNKETERHI